MVAGIDSPLSSNALIEASSNAAGLNQTSQGALLNASQLTVGKQFQAEVVATLADGTYIVKVADVAARMQLPNSPEVGAKLSLTLLSTSPRATFLLNPDGALAAGAGSAPNTATATLASSVKQLLDDFNHGAGATGLTLQSGTNVGAVAGKASDPRLLTLAQTQPDSAPANLSSTGRLVNALLQNVGQQSNVVNVSKLPLLSAPDGGAGVLAKALQGGVSSSGVFYESHLLQWAEGSLSTAQLMKEPQASYPTPAATNPAATAQASGPNPDTGLKNILLQTTGQLPDTPKPVAGSSTDSLSVLLPKEATSMIQQQLQTLEQQRFMWSGEVWPGQTMDWEITKEKPAQQKNQTDKSWNSAVKFELQQLGNISAQLQLTGNRLKLIVQAQDATSALLLKNHAHELVSALDVSGTQVEALQIKVKPADTP